MNRVDDKNYWTPISGRKDDNALLKSGRSDSESSGAFEANSNSRPGDMFRAAESLKRQREQSGHKIELRPEEILFKLGVEI